MLVISARLAPLPPRRSFMSLFPSEKSYTYLVTACLRKRRSVGAFSLCAGPTRAGSPVARSRLLRRRTRPPQPEEASMAHAKDKGAGKNVKKKAQKSVKEKRAEKKAKKGTVGRS